MAKQTIIRISGQSFMNSNGCVLVFRACSLMNLLKIKVGISEKKSNQHWGMYYDKVALILIYAYNLNKDSKASHRNQ